MQSVGLRLFVTFFVSVYFVMHCSGHDHQSTITLQTVIVMSMFTWLVPTHSHSDAYDFAPHERPRMNPQELLKSSKHDHEKQARLSRIDTTKQLFHAFINRQEAYDFGNWISLTLFGSDVKVLVFVIFSNRSFS